jgi:hypothetical protein
VRQALSNQAASWLEQAGVTVPRQENGDSVFPLEISPLFALSVGELQARLKTINLKVNGTRYLDQH